MSGEALCAAVGETPLVELQLPDRLGPNVRLFGKLECVLPGGSLKDRPVLRIVREGLRRGDLDGERRLLDSSSGNAGIAYAWIGAALGVPVTLVVPGNASAERLARIRAYGAELILTDPIEGYDHAIHTARRLAAEQPDRYWYADQYGNDDNWRAHHDGTGAEILAQVETITGRAPDALVIGVGTGGSLTGIGRRLRAANPDLHITSVVPEIFPGIEGLKPLGHDGDLVPAILDESLIDRRVEVTLDEAIGAARQIAGQGLFVGPSAGAYVHAACDLAAEGVVGGGPHGETILVTLLCDTGERYVSTGMWGGAGAQRPVR
ncbi:MAG: cysteine synthase family protein [Acidobacteriota bacterium]